MAKKFQLRKGFLKMQRLGPVKFGEQSRWSARAPESHGLWAFPDPHFDIYYAYHKYTDLLPKRLREDYPKDLRWWRRSAAKGELDFGGVHEFPSPEKHQDNDYPVSSWDEIEWDTLGDYSFPRGYYVSSGYYRAQDQWIEEVGKKVLPMREFWYSGDLYSRFNSDGTVGNTYPSSSRAGDWTLMDVEQFAKFMAKGGVRGFEGSYDGDGKPRSFKYSSDHLEVFIPRGRGVIRDRI